jgi:hypothetical protein
MRYILRSLTLAAALATGAAGADETAVSARIARTGLAATADSLAGASTPGDRFALGGVLFLRAVEKALQTRWRHGMARSSGFLPVLRLPVPANPEPDPFRPELVADILQTLIDDMEAARAPLPAIADSDDFGVVLALDDIWFDIDMNGTRSPEESLLRVAGIVLRGGFRAGTAGTAAPTIRFDTADAAWLAAYTHLLAGVSELALAFDPTPQIARVIAARQAMDGLGAGSDFANAYDMMLGAEIDMAAMAYFAVRQQPDPARTGATRNHLLAMIAQNRRFWRLVALETDNFAEWIPNAAQVSALGIPVPPDTGEVWQALLTDAEDLLEGRKLIPYWRLRKGAGINMARWLDDPAPVDLAEWVQGVGLLPYMEDGPRVSADNWRQLQQLVRGDAALFAIWLN